MKKEKRIAVQFFGHLRTFRETYMSFFRNLVVPNQIDGYDVDVFIHTWNEKNHSTVAWHNQEGLFVNKKLTEDDLIFMKKVYEPKMYVIDEQLVCEEKIIVEKIASAKRSIKGCINSSYSTFKVNELRKLYEKRNHIYYDWIIATRPDIFFKEKFRINDFLHIYKEYNLDILENSLFHACNPFGRGKVEDPRLLAGSDLIYFSRPENMNKASEMYLKWEKYTEPDNFYCFEIWWMNFWKAQGLSTLPIKYRHVPEFDILRDEETVKRIKEFYFPDN